MRIDWIRVKNFRGFVEKDFPLERSIDAPAGGNGSFHVFIGDNATGKTAILEALTVAAGSWFLGVRGHGSRNIDARDVRMQLNRYPESERFERQFPVEVEAKGHVLGKPMTWLRDLLSEEGRTRWVKAKSVKKAGDEAVAKVQDPKLGEIVLPIIAYYSTQRLWKEPKDMYDYYNKGENIADQLVPMQALDKVKEPEDLGAWFGSRLAGYNFSLDPRSSSKELVRWLRLEELKALQKKEEGLAYRLVKEAIVAALENCEGLRYDITLGLLARFKDHGELPFHLLSDGQRNTLALVGDLAYRAAQLNPNLSGEALARTNGIVLIDELDLHLHPNWQRTIVDSLRKIFPEIQFIATTHSPFVVQSLRQGELINLDGPALQKTENLSIDDIAEKLMGVDDTQKAAHYDTKVAVAKDYLTLVEGAKRERPADLEGFKNLLADKLAPYADDPAFQAFLELKRIGAIGE
jgi:predicted ATP-binding protein involved in virulence